MEEFVAELERRLRAVATAERAAQEKRYLKSELEFIGATVWQVGGAVKEMLAARPAISRDEAVGLAARLWLRPIHELRAAAVMVLERSASQLGPEDLPLIERFLRESRTWALVDDLAGSVLGPMVERDPARMSPTMDRWASDEDFWMRRASLLCELSTVRSGGPLDRFLARAETMLDEREFFIRKAIGWVLREAGRRRPADVVGWLGPRTHRASGVTMREAVKYLPPADADRFMTAYREKRPAT